MECQPWQEQGKRTSGQATGFAVSQEGRNAFAAMKSHAEGRGGTLRASGTGTNRDTRALQRVLDVDRGADLELAPAAGAAPALALAPAPRGRNPDEFRRPRARRAD